MINQILKVQTNQTQKLKKMKPAKVIFQTKNESKLATDSEALECTPATSSPKKSNMIAKR